MKARRITQRQALQRIERETRGFYYMSREGWIHALAAAALGMPLTEDEQRIVADSNSRYALERGLVL